MSCLDDDSWCIAGIGNRVHVMRIHGLADVTSVPLDVPNPLAALTRIGFTTAQATELLRKG